MNAFYSIFKVELLLYRRSIWLWVALAVLTGYLFLGYNAFLSVNIEVGQFLQSSGYIGMAAAIVGFLMGMLSARREHSHGFSETLSSIPGDSVRGAAKLAAWTVVVLLFTFVAALEMVVLILYVNSEFVYFWDMISSYILLYWGMTLLSCGYIGYALETLFPSRWWNLLIIFSIWVLISPMNYFILLLAPSSDAIHWSSVPLSYLNQGERNLESAYQEVQGLHISFDIWMKKIFFYLFSICIVCFVSMKQKHREQTKKERQSIVYISVACMVLIIIVAALARTPLDSEILMDYEGYYEDKDRTFYQTPQQMEPVLSDSASIKVNAYHVELSHYKNEIAYSASLDISLEKKKGDWLPFTLYHGLHVTNVRISDTSAKWSRNGDTLYIEWPDIIGKRTNFYGYQWTYWSFAPH